MGTYKTRRSRENRLAQRIKLDALKNADEFAKQTFIQLRKDDSTWHRFLRFIGLKSKQRIKNG